MRKSNYIKRIYDKKITKLFIGIIIGVLIALTPLYYATSILYNSIDVGCDNERSGLESFTVQEAIDEIASYNYCPNLTLTVGDYFTLVPDEATATTTTSGFSGSTPTADQTLWRVININNDNTIDAVSEYVSTNTFTISGENGYRYYVQGLQDIASKYAKAGYTTSTRMMGYDGQTLYYSGTISSSGTSNTPSPTTGTGSNYSYGGDTLYLKDYQLVSNVYNGDVATYGSTGLKAYNKAGTASNYYIASRRYVYSRSSSSGYYRYYYYSRGRYISNVGSLSDATLRYYYYYRSSGSWYSSSPNHAVRPIITLRSGLTVKGGLGTKTNPFVI